MNYEQAVEYIHSLLRFGSKLGLERVRELLDRLGNPEKKLKFIHVAGTNGKGSTVAMCASILQQCGYKTGMYISPFVVDFRERFQINSQMISEEKLTELVYRVKEQIEIMNKNGDEVTEFEMVTALAFLYFAEENCDIVCLEVGLGGRFDATNVIETPLVSVIASISLDHTEILGDTIEKIAFEKAGIIKKDGITVSYPLQSSPATGVLMEVCARENNRLIIPNANAVEIIKSDISGSVFMYGDDEYTVNLIGEHQVYNALTVIEVMKILNQKGFNISDECIKTGLSETRFPARFELISKKPLTVIDGAHNLDGAISLRHTLENLKIDNIVTIIAMMADKDYEQSLSKIASLCKTVFAVSASNPRSLTPEQLALTAKNYCDDVRCCSDHKTALINAANTVSENGMILICGSLYLAGDIRNLAKEIYNN